MEEIAQKHVADFNVRSIRTWFGKANAVEKYYVYAFLLSILLGVVFGFLDNSLYYLVTVIQIPKSAGYIFLHNFAVDLITVVTGGILVLLSNFLTFALISGLFDVRRYSVLEEVRVLLIVFGTYGILEMAGHLCFGLLGFTYLERFILKKKTDLRRSSLLIVGTVLIIVAAAIEGWTIISFRP
jgi:hypothetical protein